MFLKNYLNDTYYDLVIDTYEEDYLNSLDEDNFKEIYNLFKDLGFYYVDDIVLNNLELFEYDKESLRTGLNKLYQSLGSDMIKIIGKNMNYLNEIEDLID